MTDAKPNTSAERIMEIADTLVGWLTGPDSGQNDGLMAAYNALHTLLAERDAARAEVERLGRELNTSRHGPKHFGEDFHEQFVADLRAENDALRAQLADVLAENDAVRFQLNNANAARPKKKPPSGGRSMVERPGMSDDPPWLADAVEAAARAVCKRTCTRCVADCQAPPCVIAPYRLGDARAALAAFLRRVPNVSVMQARAPGQWHTTRTLADAIERLGAPDNQMQTGGRADGN